MGKLTISIAMLNSYVSLPEGNRLPEIHWLIIMCPVEMAPFWGVYPSSSAFRQTHSYGYGSKPSLSPDAIAERAQSIASPGEKKLLNQHKAALWPDHGLSAWPEGYLHGADSDYRHG